MQHELQGKFSVDRVNCVLYGICCGMAVITIWFAVSSNLVDAWVSSTYWAIMHAVSIPLVATAIVGLFYLRFLRQEIELTCSEMRFVDIKGNQFNACVDELLSFQAYGRSRILGVKLVITTKKAETFVLYGIRDGARLARELEKLCNRTENRDSNR